MGLKSVSGGVDKMPVLATESGAVQFPLVKHASEINYVAFISYEKAAVFERYLKSGAGHRFQLKHFGE